MKQALAVCEKDIRLLWSDRSDWLSAATFAIVSVLIYSFAFDFALTDVRPVLPGLLWVTFLFAGILASGHSFAHESDEGTFDAVLLAPVSRTSIYVGKVLSNTLALLVIKVAVLVVGTILFDTLLLTFELALIVVVGTLGYVSLTTLLSTVGSRVRARTVLLPVLSLPLLVPLLIAAVESTHVALREPTESSVWLLFLVIFTLWSIVASALLFPLVAER